MNQVIRWLGVSFTTVAFPTVVVTALLLVLFFWQPTFSIGKASDGIWTCSMDRQVRLSAPEVFA
jgi:hypothetical protein